MKVIILAAGRGARLRPLTDRRPKCLVPLHGRPLLEYQLSAFETAGLSDISLVTGYHAQRLESYGTRRYHNADYATTNMVYSLFCAAREFDDGEDIIVSYGDIVFEDRILKTLIESDHDLSVLVDCGWRDLWELRMPDPLEDAETLKLDRRQRILEIGRRATSYDDIAAQYIGLFKIAGRIADRIRNFYESLDQDGHERSARRYIDMTGFLHQVANRLLDAHAVPIRHGWLEIDTPEDLSRYESLPEEAMSRLFRFSPTSPDAAR